MNYARLAIVEVQGGPIAAQNMGSATTFNGLLKLFNKAGAAAPGTMSLGSITGQVVPCLNTTDEELETGDQVFVGQLVDGRWAVIPTGTSTGSGAGTPRIQFVTTGKMTNRGVAVKVLRVHNNAPDIDDTGTLVPGDTLTVYDPFNLWSDVEAKATGWAYLAQAQSDDETTAEINEEHVIRYEIEECTHPVNRIEGYVRAALYSNNSGQVVVDITDPNFAERELILSSYPNVDNPEADIIEGNTGGSLPTDYTYISCQNPYYLDAIPGSKVVIERVTNKRHSDPENYEAPLARSSDSWQWEIVQTEKRFARHIKVAYSGGAWSKPGAETENIFDGHWPRSLDSSDGLLTGHAPSITCDLCDCLSDGDEGYAFFDSNTGNYVVEATNSAFYGTPKDADVVTGAALNGCTLETSMASVKVFCDAVAGATTESSIPITSQTVATGATISIEDKCGVCEWQYQPVQNSCGSSCAWEWDSATLDWRRVEGDPECPGNCTCPVPDPPENIATIEDGDPGPLTNCVEDTGLGNWEKVAFCSGGCTCNENPNFPLYPELYDTHQEPCLDGVGEGGGKQLCVTTSSVSFNTIDCYGIGGSIPASSSKSCIDIEEDCPDACVNPVS